MGREPPAGAQDASHFDNLTGPPCPGEPSSSSKSLPLESLPLLLLELLLLPSLLLPCRRCFFDFLCLLLLLFLCFCIQAEVGHSASVHNRSTWHSKAALSLQSHSGGVMLDAHSPARHASHNQRTFLPLLLFFLSLLLRCFRFLSLLLFFSLPPAPSVAPVLSPSRRARSSASPCLYSSTAQPGPSRQAQAPCAP